MCNKEHMLHTCSYSLHAAFFTENFYREIALQLDTAALTRHCRHCNQDRYWKHGLCGNSECVSASSVVEH